MAHGRCSYVQRERLLLNIDDYITGSTWGNDGGLVGALALAQQAYAESREAGAAEREDEGALGNVDFATLGLGV